MMLCSRCKKRPAVVLITAMQGNQKKNEGLCLVCAKELNIPQVDEYMKQMGITEEELKLYPAKLHEVLGGDTTADPLPLSDADYLTIYQNAWR